MGWGVVESGREVLGVLKSVVFWKVFKGINSESRLLGFHPHSTVYSPSDLGQVTVSGFFFFNL